MIHWMSSLGKQWNSVGPKGHNEANDVNEECWEEWTGHLAGCTLLTFPSWLSQPKHAQIFFEEKAQHFTLSCWTDIKVRYTFWYTLIWVHYILCYTCRRVCFILCCFFLNVHFNFCYPFMSPLLFLPHFRMGSLPFLLRFQKGSQQYLLLFHKKVRWSFCCPFIKVHYSAALLQGLTTLSVAFL